MQPSNINEINLVAPTGFDSEWQEDLSFTLPSLEIPA
jgi:hypothetical protein